MSFKDNGKYFVIVSHFDGSMNLQNNTLHGPYENHDVASWAAEGFEEMLTKNNVRIKAEVFHESELDDLRSRSDFSNIDKSFAKSANAEGLKNIVEVDNE